jgi:ubiquinone biosynthesis protein COQ9
MMDDRKQTLLLEALKEIPFSGISDASLSAAAERAGATSEELGAYFPEGPASLVESFSHWADAQMAERMRLEAPERMRERIAKAVRSRIEAISPHKEAARRAAAFLALPQNAPLAAKLLFDSVDAMWRAAGDRSSDFSYYTKRALLAGVYGSTLIYWFSDSSDGNAESWAFLDARIDDVMKIQKVRSDVEEMVAKLPDPFGVLAAMRMRK